MIHLSDIVRVLTLITLVLVLIHIGAQRWPKTSLNPERYIVWADVRYQMIPYFPGRPMPTGCSFTYMSPEGLSVCMVDKPDMTLAITSKMGYITSVSASFKGYVTLGDMALVEGEFERVDGRSYTWGEMTAYSFELRKPTRMFKAISHVSVSHA